MGHPHCQTHFLLKASIHPLHLQLSVKYALIMLYIEHKHATDIHMKSMADLSKLSEIGRKSDLLDIKC